MTGGLARRVDRLAALTAAHTTKQPAMRSIKDELLSDNPTRLAGVIEALLGAHVLDRFCYGCGGQGVEVPNLAAMIADAGWDDPMPWDLCSNCGHEVRAGPSPEGRARSQ